MYIYTTVTERFELWPQLRWPEYFFTFFLKKISIR